MGPDPNQAHARTTLNKTSVVGFILSLTCVLAAPHPRLSYKDCYLCSFLSSIAIDIMSDTESEAEPAAAAVVNLSDEVISKIADRAAEITTRLLATNNLVLHDHMEDAIKEHQRGSKVFQRRGNQQQYDHAKECTATLEQIDKHLDRSDVAKAKRSLENSKVLLNKRIKLIIIADWEGWGTVTEYLTDDLASDSEDETHLQKAIKAAAAKQERTRKSFTAPSSKFLNPPPPPPRPQPNHSYHHTTPIRPPPTPVLQRHSDRRQMLRAGAAVNGDIFPTNASPLGENHVPNVNFEQSRIGNTKVGLAPWLPATYLITSTSGRIQVPPEALHCVNPLTVAVGGKLRLVLDLRHVNQYLDVTHFKYENLNVVAQLFERHFFFFTFDLQNGYHHVPIAARHSK